jgi:glycosyltransferase involved in cell wall biosynthesis
MRILFTVEAYLPARNGMQEVVSQLSERLVRKGYDITIATAAHKERNAGVINGVHIREFNVQGNAVQGYSGDTESYKQYLLQSDFDVVVSFAAQQWATDLALPILKQIKGKKVFVPTGFSGLNLPAYKEYYQQMKSWLHDYDMNVFLSDTYRDIVFAKHAGVSNLVIIPNGASADEFLQQTEIDIRQALHIPASATLILHVGTFTGAKGQLEALRIFNKAHIRNTVLLLAGNSPAAGGITAKVKNFIKFGLSLFTVHRPIGAGYYRLMAACSNWLYLPNLLRNKKVIVTGLDRKRVVAAFRAADLFLFPSMIECSPIVLFESMAGQTAFLTTDVGNSAEIIEWTGGGVLLPTEVDATGISHVQIAAAAQELEKQVVDTAGRATLRENGHAAFLQKFTWEKITEQYDQLFKQLVAH